VGYALGAAAAKLQTMVALQDTPGPMRTFMLSEANDRNEPKADSIS